MNMDIQEWGLKMNEKIISIPIPDTYNYVRLFNGLMNLTDMEIMILAEFIDLKMTIDKAEININPFSTEMKKKVAEKLDRKDFNTLNTYIKNFAEKGAIVKINDGYMINPVLIPTGKKEKISFIINE